MFLNFFKFGWRKLVRNPGHSAISIVGLALGILSCLIITLYIQQEWSFDRFHDKADQIYRVTRQVSEEGTERQTGILEGTFASNITADLPEVENAFRIAHKNKTLLRNGDTAIYKSRPFYTDPAIFEVFDVTVISKSVDILLNDPGTIVITESLAKRLFGSGEAVGQDLYLDQEQDPYRVTAVVRDFPHNSHFSFEFLLPMPDQLYGLDQSQWADFAAFYTYILLDDRAEPESVENKVPSWGQAYYEEGHFDTHSYRLQPLTEIHLYSNLEQEIQPERIGKISYLYIFATVVFLILVIAVVNHVNLVTVKSVDRSVEIGVRKVLGAGAGSIRMQFLGESFMQVMIAVILALSLTEFFLNLFNNFLGLSLEFNILENVPLQLLLLAIMSGTVLLSGSYPALVMSRLSPAQSLKGKSIPVAGQSVVRKGLVVFQFAVSSVLILCTLMIWNQLNFVQSSRLGLDKNRVVSLVIPSRTSSSSYSVLKQRVGSLAGIEEVSGSMSLPSRITTPPRTAEINGEPVQFNWNMVDENYFEVLGIDQAVGNGFEGLSEEQRRFKVVVNESFLTSTGRSAEEIVGKKVPIMRLPFEVVGVVRDFHYESLREQIAPQLIQYHHSAAVPGYLSARFNNASLTDLLSGLRKIWEETYPSHPFEYFFLEDSFEQLYTSDRRLANTFSTFGILAILISVTGLLSLVGYSGRKRQKEIGIRKVMGATTERILLLLSRDFIKLVILGCIFAIPAAWFLMSRWLSDFAYRADIGVIPFLVTGVIIVTATLLTVLLQSYRTAGMNPVDSLRDE